MSNKKPWSLRRKAREKRQADDRNRCAKARRQRHEDESKRLLGVQARQKSRK